MRRALEKLRAMALIGLTCAGAFSAPAATPIADGWKADPEAQFLLDVNLRRLRLGDGVRAYQTPEGTCVLFGDFLTALDVPMKIDLAAKKASGWAFKEQHRIAIDLSGGTVTYGETTENLARGTVRETPEGWCVDTAALSRWFKIGVKPNTNASALVLESEAKLPVEMAIERERRAAQIKPAKFDLKSLPQVRLPYRMWRAPALDFVVSAGVTYRASDGVRVDRSSSVYAAGEIARLSYDAQLSTNEKGIPNTLRLRAYRSDPDARAAGSAEGHPFRVRRRQRPRQRPRRIGRERARRRRHQPAPVQSDGVRQDAVRRRFAGGLGSRALPQRGIARLRQAERQLSAIPLKTFSFCTAKTGSASSFTGPRARSGPARR